MSEKHVDPAVVDGSPLSLPGSTGQLNGDGEFSMKDLIGDTPNAAWAPGTINSENEQLRSKVEALSLKLKSFSTVEDENSSLKEKLAATEKELQSAQEKLVSLNEQVKEHFQELPDLRAAKQILEEKVASLKEDLETKTDEFDRKNLDFEDMYAENQELHKRIASEESEKSKNEELAEKYRKDLERVYNEHANDSSLQKTLAQKEMMVEMITREKDQLEAELEEYKRRQRDSHKELQDRMTLITKGINTIKLVDPENGARDLDRVIATFSRDRKDEKIEKRLGEDLYQLFGAVCELVVQYAYEKMRGTGGQSGPGGLNRMGSTVASTPRDGSMSARGGGANWITMSKGTQ